ncbi:hypothetical protein L7F22_014667 [Adiantum nelumboides]|nr:hypothetical protein [Adiantum nelumboides]
MAQLPLCLIILLMLSSFGLDLAASKAQYLAQRQFVANSSSFMRLDWQLNLSPFNSNMQNKKVWTFALPNLGGGLFFPILSSPSFDIRNSSALSRRPLNLGFSLGFYAWCNYDDHDYDHGMHRACEWYMAVCAGSSGSRHTTQYWSNNDTELEGPVFEGGFAVPVWFANLDRGMKHPEKASLVLLEEAVAGKKTQELQLRESGDGDIGEEQQVVDHVLWSIKDATLMEVSDSGELLIYNASGARVFQTSSIVTDTLVQGQRLSVGKRLTSNNSAYSAVVEPGGLALYLNSASNSTGSTDPYWAFPFFRDPHPNNITHSGLISTYNSSIDQLLQSPPPSCNRDPPYIYSETSRQCIFHLGSCSSYVSQYEYSLDVNAIHVQNLSIYFSFLRLENDGKLYLYSVLQNSSSNLIAGYERAALDSEGVRENVELAAGAPFSKVQDQGNMSTQHVLGPLCDTPLGCGPLGVCNPKSQPTCSCPEHPSFEAVDRGDFTKGCKRSSSDNMSSSASQQINPQHLDLCRISSNMTITFVEFLSTTNIFLLTGWTLQYSSTEFTAVNSTLPGAVVDDRVHACKQACSVDCSCQGISYHKRASACFLIVTQAPISFINLSSDSTLTLYNYTGTSKDTLILQSHIFKDDYVTHLKVASLKPEPEPASAPAPKPKQKGGFPLLALRPIGLGVGLTSTFLLALLAYRLWRQKRRRMLQAKEEEELRDILPLLPTRFAYRELSEATKGFSKLLGAGACGSVYEGTLRDGRRVAVKVLEGVLQGARQAKEFLAEIATVGRTGHQNIVRLVGFCWQISHRILVYEFAERGSLDHCLFMSSSEQKGAILDWQQRYNVALGVASGLHYLHEECEHPILHSDIKPQNILLTDAFVAKISDFGMSRLMQRDKSLMMTGVRGTPGYIAPEWFSFCHGSVSKKSDIYSLGMVMLELVAGRRVLELSLLAAGNSNSVSGLAAAGSNSCSSASWHLPSWAAKKWQQGCLMDIVDPRLKSGDVDAGAQYYGFNEAEAQTLLYTALWCIHDDPSLRPQAATVVQWLESRDPTSISQPSHLLLSTSSATSTAQGLPEY